MGSGLARRAFEVATEKNLGHASTRLLVWMALNVRDEDEPPRYFGGATHRAAGVGAGKERAVRALVSELKTAGAIEEIRSAHRGHNAEYELTFRPVDNSRKEAEEVPPLVEKGGRFPVTKAAPQLPPYPPRDNRSRQKRGGRPLASCGHPALPGVDRYCERGCMLEVTA